MKWGTRNFHFLRKEYGCICSKPLSSRASKLPFQHPYFQRLYKTSMKHRTKNQYGCDHFVAFEYIQLHFQDRSKLNEVKADVLRKKWCMRGKIYAVVICMWIYSYPTYVYFNFCVQRTDINQKSVQWHCNWWITMSSWQRMFNYIVKNDESVLCTRLYIRLENAKAVVANATK